MRRIFQYMMLAMSLSMVSFSMQSCGREDVIEEEHLAQIYAEMLMTDQWINSTPGVRMIADTSLVYEPILKKYGYTSAEYRNSVEYYLEDPDEYADQKRSLSVSGDRRPAGTAGTGAVGQAETKPFSGRIRR